MQGSKVAPGKRLGRLAAIALLAVLALLVAACSAPAGRGPLPGAACRPKC